LESKAPIIDLAQRGTGDGVIEYLVRRLKETHAHISAVRLNESAVTDRGLKSLADAHIPLLQLSLKDTKITSAGLQSVAKIRTLEKLELNNDHGIESSSLKYLGQLKKLKTLDLSNVVHDPSKEEDFAFISDLKALKLLNLDSSAGLPPRVFKYAEGLSGLDSLSCRYSGLTDQSLQDIGRIKSLTELDLWDGTYTDKGIENLARLTGLKQLDCGGRWLTKASFPVFVQLPNLTDLVIRRAIRISEADIDALRKEMPNCRIIKLKE
jgi:Leucine-rich repeat (LRR) protein